MIVNHKHLIQMFTHLGMGPHFSTTYNKVVLTPGDGYIQFEVISFLNFEKRISSDEQLIEILSKRSRVSGVMPDYISAQITAEVEEGPVFSHQVVVDVSTIQAFLRNKPSNLVEIYVNEDGSWGFRSSTKTVLAEGKWEEVSTLGEAEKLYRFPNITVDIPSESADSTILPEEVRLVLKKWELADIATRCVQTMNLQEVFSDKNRNILRSIYFEPKEDRWYAYSTDGRTMSEFKINTPQVSNLRIHPFNLHRDTVKFFRAFDTVYLTPCVLRDDSSKKLVQATLFKDSFYYTCVVAQQEGTFPNVNAIFSSNSNTPYSITLKGDMVRQLLEKYYSNFPKTGYSVTNGKTNTNQYIEFSFKASNKISVCLTQGRSFTEAPEICILASIDTPTPEIEEKDKKENLLYNARLFCNILRSVSVSGFPLWEDVTMSWGNPAAPITLKSSIGRAIVMPLRSV